MAPHCRARERGRRCFLFKHWRQTGSVTQVFHLLTALRPRMRTTQLVTVQKKDEWIDEMTEEELYNMAGTVRQ